jgi:hypothetical protein
LGGDVKHVADQTAFANVAGDVHAGHDARRQVADLHDEEPAFGAGPTPVTVVAREQHGMMITQQIHLLARGRQGQGGLQDRVVCVRQINHLQPAVLVEIVKRVAPQLPNVGLNHLGRRPGLGRIPSTKANSGPKRYQESSPPGWGLKVDGPS